MDFTQVQIFIMGIVATFIAQAFKVLAGRFGLKMGRKPVTLVAFAASIGLGLYWQMPDMPPLPAFPPDPMQAVQAILQYLMDLLGSASSVVGWSVAVYNWLLESVFDKLNLT